MKVKGIGCYLEQRVEDVTPGMCFEYNNKIFIRMFGGFHDTAACDLKSGQAACFGAKTSVTPLMLVACAQDYLDKLEEF